MDEDALPAYEPSSPRRNLKIPKFEVKDVAVEMLRLLSNQQQARQQQRRELYHVFFLIFKDFLLIPGVVFLTP